MESGINIKDLPAGTVVFAQTRQSLYKLIVTKEQGQILAQGGHYLPEPKEVRFHGSTWGGSMLKKDWIGCNMRLEMGLGPGRILTTSSVRTLKIMPAPGAYYA